MRLIVEPREGRADEVPQVRVVDAPPGVPVTLTIEATDAAGHRWRSVTPLDPEAADPSAAWWGMEFVDADQAPVAFTAAPDRLEFHLRAEAGDVRAEAVAVRRWAQSPPAVVEGEGFRLTTFAPAGGAPAPGVLVVPGSMGTASVLPRAGLLAAHGYTTAVLSYMQEPGLPPALCEIPLETIAAGLRAFAASPEVADGKVVVLSGSVGTGGALATLASFEDLDPRGLVALAPTHVVWQALGEDGPPPKASSWSLGGQPLPWVRMRGERVLPELVRHALLDRFRRHPVPKALHLHAAYDAGLADDDAVAAATIAVERIRCPLLLVAGDDDQMWPATRMAEAIAARRARDDDRLLTLPEAGHFLFPPLVPTTVPWSAGLVSGGTAEGNARADAAAWTATLDFLDERLRRD